MPSRTKTLLPQSYTSTTASLPTKRSLNGRYHALSDGNITEDITFSNPTDLTGAMAQSRVAPKRKRSEDTTATAKKAKKAQATSAPPSLTPGSYDTSKLWEFKTPAWYEEGPRSEEQFGPLYSYKRHAAIVTQKLQALASEAERFDRMCSVAMKSVNSAKSKLKKLERWKACMSKAEWSKEQGRRLKKMSQAEASVERIKALASERRVGLQIGED